LDVAIADSGREIYSWPGARRIELEEAELLTGGGPFGSGPFGPFLYVSESVVRFGEGDEPKAGVESHPTAAPKPLPPGLAVALRLETEIDTDVAAVGDPVIAKVARDVVTSPGDTSARLVVLAGAVARGRVIKLEHNIEGRSYFLIALRFETLEIRGAVVPLNVKLPRKVQSGSVFWDVRSQTSFPETGTLVFRTRAQKHVLPKGYESTWMTFNPKG
jgi:hypothetical protein